MITFGKLKEKVGKRSSTEVVFNKRINRVPVTIHKQASEYVVIIDGDKLDSYGTQKEAEKMAKEFVRQYKG